MQIDLPLRTWGGVRKKAGRKPNASRALVSRKARPQLNGRSPIHVTLRVLPEIPSLRVLNGWVRRALIAGASKPGFRLIHFAIMSNHLHLIVEAESTPLLSRGIQGITVRIARAVNTAISRKRGKVFSDRFHEHVLATPREAKAAVHYVIHNFRKHMLEAGRRLPEGFVDLHSSESDRSGLPAAEFWLTCRSSCRAISRVRGRRGVDSAAPVDDGTHAEAAR